MSVRVGWVLIGVSLIGSLALLDVYRRGEGAAAESARRLAYFPLELKSPVVYRLTKSLSRRVVSEKFGSTVNAGDAYFSRLRIEGGRAMRSAKCDQLSMALSTTSETKSEQLVDGPDGVRLGGSELLLVPPITPLKPTSFALTFGLTRGGDGFFGWPLMEVIGLTDEENKLFVELGPSPGNQPVFIQPEIDRQVLFNVMREETVRFFQSDGEEIKLGGRSLKTVKLEYSGQLTKRNSYHQIGGAIWLAPGLGVVKEQRQVVVKIYPREVLDESKGSFARPHGDFVLYEASVIKLLAHPI